jgi:hypothetical protein
MAEYRPTETQWDFMTSPAYVRVISGAVGSGKSVCAIHELFRLAMQQEPNRDGERKSRALLVRNTASQLDTTVKRTLFTWFPPGVWGAWKEQKKEYHVRQRLGDGTVLDFQIWLLPLDAPADVQRALSLEITFLFINEWREIHPEVVDGLLARLKRYPSGPDGTPTRSCAIFDTNMCQEDSWHHDKMINPPPNWSIHIQPPAVLDKREWLSQYGEDPDPATGIESYDDPQEGTVTLWVNPGADNISNLPSDYYQDILPGKSRDYVDVYLRCRFGRSLKGVPVYDRTFNSAIHVAKEPHIPLRSAEYPIIIGQDFGRRPAAVLVQKNAHGQVVVLAQETSTNTGIETFLDTKLRPLLAQSRFIGCTFIVAPDPAGYAKTQVNDIAPVDVIKRLGFKLVKPATNDPERRIMTVERLLTGTVGGRPMLQINPECTHLIKGMRYGYKYRRDKHGVADEKPEKTGEGAEWTDDNDALQYACMIIEGNMLAGSYFGNNQRREIKRVQYAWS